ncbi:hypothetical protein [Yersinia enterocolitica]|uniref:hypothetical protein n=1 Tax=Yersinia enterocolitica TaxID=630 RepID=UPI003DAD2970
MTDDKKELPERLYYPLNEAAEKLGCSIKDIIHYGATGALKICIYINYDAEEKKPVMHLGLSNKKANEVDEFNIISGEGWFISGIGFNEYKNNEILSSGYYAKHISGFFYIIEDDLVPIEFDLEQESLKLYHVSTGIEENDLEDNIDISFIMLGISVPVRNLCVMAKHIKELTGKKSEMPSFDGSNKKIRKPNANKQSKLIKALIEICYGVGSSENPYSLINEERGTGDMLEDFQRMGINPPITGKTLSDYLKDVELDYVQIPTVSVDISKK